MRRRDLVRILVPSSALRAEDDTKYLYYSIVVLSHSFTKFLICISDSAIFIMNARMGHLSHTIDVI